MKRKLAVTLGLIGLMGISISAKPLYQEIKAIINPNIEYELDGEIILDGQGGLVYQDKIYMPIRDMAEALNIDVDYQAGKVILSNESELIDKDLDEEFESESFKGAVIDVDVENKTIFILNDKDSEIVLNVSDETTFFGKHGESIDKRLYNIQDIEKGMDITGLKSTI